jgi:prepilin-type N-terminal cleavage/methylation domain-containing protein
MTTCANTRSRPVGASPRTGFSLLELLLAMAVLVIMIGVSAPTLANFFHGRALDYEARQFLALTRQGQSRAACEGVPMELWVDAEQRKYGLQEESSYSKTSADDTDPKALEFELNRDVQIEVPNLPISKPTSTVMRNSSTPTSTASVAPVVSKHANLPRIRFLPDGSLGETSPQRLHLSDRDGGSRWVVLARNRLNYEIQTAEPK